MKEKFTLYRNNAERLFCIEVFSLDAEKAIRHFFRNDEGEWIEDTDPYDTALSLASKIDLTEQEAHAFKKVIEKSIPGCFDKV